MVFCSKKIQVVAFSFLSSIFPLLYSIGGGIIPYAYCKNGNKTEAYIFVTCDSFTQNNLWGDLGISSIKTSEDIFDQISQCAHFGTLGLFSDNGIDFFSLKIQDDKCKSFFTKHQIGKSELFYHLFFVEVPFVPAHLFMENLSFFRVNYGSLAEYKNYFRRNGFAWIKVSELLHLLNSLNNRWKESRHQICFKMPDKSHKFISKSLDLAYKNCDLILNEYLAEELRSPAGISMLQSILFHEN